MGWGSAGDIAEPVINAMQLQVGRGQLTEKGATTILAALIKQLQAGDWDTEEETLGTHKLQHWVVQAFAQCGVREEGFYDPA